ncbi:hypothetical protein EON65_25880 [archaeon]|nr:MAG: hypothetical protein EON65_25880 [archaeon]
MSEFKGLHDLASSSVIIFIVEKETDGVRRQPLSERIVVLSKVSVAFSSLPIGARSGILRYVILEQMS